MMKTYANQNFLKKKKDVLTGFLFFSFFSFLCKQTVSSTSVTHLAQLSEVNHSNFNNTRLLHKELEREKYV